MEPLCSPRNRLHPRPRLSGFGAWSREGEFLLARGAAHALRSGRHALNALEPRRRRRWHTGGAHRSTPGLYSCRAAAAHLHLVPRSGHVPCPRHHGDAPGRYATAGPGARIARRATRVAARTTTPRAALRTLHLATPHARREDFHDLSLGPARAVVEPSPRARTRPHVVRGPPTPCACPPTRCTCLPTQCVTERTCCARADTRFGFARARCMLPPTLGIVRATASLRRRTLRARAATRACSKAFWPVTGARESP